MSVTVQIPTPLRGFTGEQSEIQVSAATVGEALEGLVDDHPDLRQHLFTAEGRLRSFVNVFLNDEDIRHLGGDQAAVTPGDSLLIIPSIAGGHR